MTTGIINDQNLEKQIQKQMGCMTGLLQLFDRHQMLTGKRLYTTKRLPPATGVDVPSETEKSVGSPEISKEPEKAQPTRLVATPSPDRYKSSQSTELRSPATAYASSGELPPKSPLPLPIFELNEGTRYSLKFCKETPRLSLDSRATFDAAKGSLYAKQIRSNSGHGDDDKNRRSTSVIARLMGLEPIPNSSSTPESIVKQAELRRSASESRVPGDIFQNRVIAKNNNYFQPKKQNQSHSAVTHIISNVIRERNVDPMEYSSKNSRSELPRASNRGFKSPPQRKSFFDSADFFPEPKQTVLSYGEIERRLKMRGIDEPSKDLETLKQILEATQLKGLLHSKKPPSQIRNKNFVYDRNYSFSSDDQSPIVLMKPLTRRVGNETPSSNVRSKSGVRQNESIPSVNPGRVSPGRERPSFDRNTKSPTRARNPSSPTRSESNVKSSNSLVRTQRRVNESIDPRKGSPINTPKRNTSDQAATNRSPRNRKATAQIYAKEKISTTEDESSSSISESSFSTPSQTDTERSKTEEYKEGRSLLERCDKLLHSIAEMNAAELQPSPVSVLDSSFYKEESPYPSPVMKRSISFTDEEFVSPGTASIPSRFEDEIEDCDFVDFIYISEILRASSYHSEEADIFLLLEKQQYLKGNNNDTSKVSRLQRKLIFETVSEILDRNRKMPTWILTNNSHTAKPPSLRQIWSEFQRIRQRDTSDDVFGIVCGVLKKDLAVDATSGWGDCQVGMSEAVLDIERLIFKDLIGESIAEFAANSSFLVF